MRPQQLSIMSRKVEPSGSADMNALSHSMPTWCNKSFTISTWFFMEASSIGEVKASAMLGFAPCRSSKQEGRWKKDQHTQRQRKGGAAALWPSWDLPALEGEPALPQQNSFSSPQQEGFQDGHHPRLKPMHLGLARVLKWSWFREDCRSGQLPPDLWPKMTL